MQRFRVCVQLEETFPGFLSTMLYKLEVEFYLQKRVNNLINMFKRCHIFHIQGQGQDTEKGKWGFWFTKEAKTSKMCSVISMISQKIEILTFMENLWEKKQFERVFCFACFVLKFLQMCPHLLLPRTKLSLYKHLLKHLLLRD